ncbi:MAG: STAS domain-containing protein, partial [Armatimonadota bacterium]
VMKKKIIKINLSRLIAKNVVTRQSISLIKHKIFDIYDNLRNVIIIFDFAGVEFISRSFADELLNFKEKLKNRDIESNFINTNKEISDMFKMINLSGKRKIKMMTIKTESLDKLAFQF